MFEADKKSPLDRLKKALYSRNSSESEIPRHDIHGFQVNVPESWESEQNVAPDAEVSMMPVTPERRYAYKIILICSALFLVAAFGIAAYTFFGGGNFVSVDNVDILIQGPASIAGGDPLSLDVSVANKNQTDIQLVDLIAEYPSGTKDPANPSTDLSRVRISLGDIKSQSVAQKTLASLMFGQEGDVRSIKFTAEYRTADSNAIFFKEKTYNVTISSSPLLVAVDSLDKVLSDQSFDMTITVSSNSTAPVKNLLLSLDYPFGFSVISSSPSATYGNNIWNLGDLAPGAKRTITIHASASGQDTEQKTVHANVGIQSMTNERDIATTIVSQDHTFTIEKPFLGLDLTLDGNHSDLAVAPGHSVNADIIWTNNSASSITNAKITAKLSGNILDKNSVTADNGGYYDSVSNSITWQSGRTDGLDTIAPGDNGRVSFNLSSLQSSGQSVSNPQITISVTAEGSRVDESGAPQDIQTGTSHIIKLVSNLALSARALYSQGPIKNSGPMPPKVDNSTTYTIIWTVTNTSNTITGAKVSATLPPYVSWTGVTSPSDANISYDSKSGVVTWVVGEVPSNAGIGSGAQQVAFQISLKPSANQAGTVPDIIGQSLITGTDVFTGSSLQNNTQSLSTRLSTDLLYKAGDETVKP